MGPRLTGAVPVVWNRPWLTASSVAFPRCTGNRVTTITASKTWRGVLTQDRALHPSQPTWPIRPAFPIWISQTNGWNSQAASRFAGQRPPRPAAFNFGATGGVVSITAARKANGGELKAVGFG